MQDKNKSRRILFFHAEPQPVLSKDSARRVKNEKQKLCKVREKKLKRKFNNFFSEPQPALCKAERFVFLIPSRSLSYLKIVQGERRTKIKAAGFCFFMPSRSLSYQKIVQGE
ncbi:MAG: hypothetical protein MR605_04370 [Bacteroidales bacterium]|nr:hypothetical protein [Bacteroidales bacterium]